MKMKEINIKQDAYWLTLTSDGHTLRVSDGAFSDLRVCEAPLFSLRVRRVGGEGEQWLDSASAWASVDVAQTETGYRFTFCDPCGICGFRVTLAAEVTERGIYWTAEVVNESDEWSAMEMSYPSVTLCASRFDLFVPKNSGMVIADAGTVGFAYRGGQSLCMQYFAAYGAHGGLYYGLHDPAPALKRYDIAAGEGRTTLSVFFVGVDGLRPHNSFALAGKCAWLALTGDWYDASQIYADFVRREAEWLPRIDENGRPDTAQKWKDIPFWVCDYIPNSERQGENRPMSLAADSDKQTKDYWIRAVIDLQRELNVPIGYHVYNWHEIPFNVDYPHFLPAKPLFADGLDKLRKNGNILVVPYINALSWETRDDFDGRFDVTFANTGRKGAVKLETGACKEVEYPQTHGDGKPVMLAAMCPTDGTWRKLIQDLVAQMEDTLPIDGIYFDQASSSHGTPCYDESHGHPTGGGRYFCDGYRRMMTDIIARKPKDSFYFSEDNTEEYMNLFDGFLTWRWLMAEEVPAFPAVYAGYILTLGRSTIGKKKEDVEFFKYSMAQAFLYGQQLGWCKADVLYDEGKLPFLKTLVRERYRYGRLFLCADMLRPPRVRCDAPPKTTSPALSNKTDVVMEQVLAGAWRQRTDGKVVLFVINVGKAESAYSLTIPYAEYGLSASALAEQGFTVDGEGRATKTGCIGGESMLDISFS